MLRHSLLIAFRNIRRHKSSFLINLIGLSTGLASTFLIFLWVHDERSFDRFHVNDERLYQVMERSEENGHVVIKEMTQGPLAEAMQKDLPEVAASVPVLSLQNDGTNVLLKSGEKNVKSSGVFAGSNFFSVFSFPLLSGNKEMALSEKNNIVLTRPLAINLFGSEAQALGKRVDFEFMGMQKQLMVSGVTDPPANNSQKFDFVLTYDLLMKDLAPNMKEWYNEGPSTYLVLKPGVDAERLSTKIRDFIKNYRKETNFTLLLRPYSSAYLYGRYEEGKQAGGRIEYVRLFSIVALFILIIACINFMNLSTAKASRRMKEVGIKKAIGSTRKALILQFLSEALLMSLLALIVAVFLVLLLLPVFNEVTGKQLEVKADPQWIVAGIGISVITGLLSGSYPALYLSGFNPIAVLKGRVRNSVGELLARKGLVVFQFMISLVLIIAVMVVYKQIDYVQSKNLGYDRTNILYFDKEGTVVKNAPSFLAELKKIPGVMNASAIQQSVVQVNQGASTYGIQWPGKSENEQVNFNIRMVDFDLLETLGISISQGRSFSRNFGGEDDKLIFNETAIRTMGLKDPIGTKVIMWGKEMSIAGVVKDFHLTSLHEPIGPMVFRYMPENTSMVMVRLAPGKEKETIAALGSFYKKYNPGYSFSYNFLDEAYQAQYLSEQRVSLLSRYFAVLAILISCLGLFGLATFNAEVRTKEIGIRKVLGASVSHVMMMLSKDFVKLVGIAIVLAFPLAWWMMSQWLNGFAYRTSIGAWIFIVAGCAILLITLATVSYQSLRSALMNPVKSLRSE